MKTNYEKLREFNRVSSCDDLLFEEWVALRSELIEEEFKEVMEAIDMFKSRQSPETVANLLKELCDLVYVTMGMATKYDFPIEEAYTAVCDNNLTKLEEPIRRREDGKILKPDSYRKVDLLPLVKEVCAAIGLE